MPKINKVFTLDITPQQFIDNCSDLELIELEFILSQKDRPIDLKAFEAQPILDKIKYFKSEYIDADESGDIDLKNWCSENLKILRKQLKDD